MKILYISVIEQNAGWGAEGFVNEGFRKAGYETITLDYRKNRNCLGQKFLELEDFDVLFLQRGDGFPVELLRAVNRPKFFWASELVARNIDQDVLLNSGQFSHIFAHSNNCRELIKRYFPNARETIVSTLINGFHEALFFPIAGINKTIDVLFVGNITPRRRRFLDELKKRVQVEECSSAYGASMNLLLNRAKLVLNIHADNFLDTETRVFEALGSRAFLISEVLGSENPFIPGVHYVETSMGNIDEMVEKIKYYLLHEEEREKIATEGYKEAIKKHTYEKRAVYIGETMESFINVKNSKLEAIDKLKVKQYIEQ